MASCPCVSLSQGDSKRSCPFRLALSASSPGDFRPVFMNCLQSSLHCCRLANGSPKWPFALRPTCRNIRQHNLLINRVSYCNLARLSRADPDIFSQAAPPVEKIVLGLRVGFVYPTLPATCSPHACKDAVRTTLPLEICQTTEVCFRCQAIRDRPQECSSC